MTCFIWTHLNSKTLSFCKSHITTKELAIHVTSSHTSPCKHSMGGGEEEVSNICVLFNIVCTRILIFSAPAELHIHFRVLTQGVFYLCYSCSKIQCGTGGSREPPVPIKGVPAIRAIAARKHNLGQVVRANKLSHILFSSSYSANKTRLELAP